MKRKQNLIRLAILTTVFALGTTLTISITRASTKVEAAQYLDDYAPYTYSGDYYSSIDFTASEGLNGELRQAITELSIPNAFYTYGGTGANHLSTVLQSADEDPNNSNNMIYLYTRDSVAKNAASSWNREHVWCQSLSNGNWSGNKGEKEAGTDILHIRPVYQSTNSSRGNDLYGDNNKAIPKKYNNMLYGYKGSEYFEPIDQVKGDVARIVMYVWTTYTGYDGYSPISITNVFENYDTLLRWHTMDKPDLLEGKRNNYAEGSIQGNRNPFVDHPELAWKIFGNNASSAVKNACMEAYPASGSVTPPGPGPQPSGDETTLNFSLASYATANSVSSGTKVSTITPDSVVTLEAVGSDSNTGRIYSNDTYTEWRFYSSGSGTLKITVANGYELLSASGQIGTSNYGTPSTVNFTVTDNKVEYSPGSNFNVKSLSITYAPIPTIIEPTGISLNESELTIDVGEEVQLTATLEPEGAEGTVIWSSSDEDVATVENGLITAVAEGTATITAKINDDITAECEITVNPVTIVEEEYIRVAAYDFSSDNSSNVEYASNDNVLTRFKNSISSNAGLPNIVTEVSNSSKVYAGYQGYYNFGLKLGASGTPGTFTLALNQEVDRVVVNTAGWDTSDNLTIGDAAAQTPGVAYNAANAMKTLTYDITSSDEVTFTYTNRGYIQSIDFYIKNPNYDDSTPYDYLNTVTTTATIHGTEGLVEKQLTDRITFAERGLESGSKYTTPFKSDNSIFTITFGAGAYDGNYYSTGSGIRTYGNGYFIIKSEIDILQINLTFASGNDYKPDSEDIVDVGTYNPSTYTWTGNAKSVTFTRPSGAGHWRLQSVMVTYLGEAFGVTNASMRFGAIIPVETWETIASKWEISDYGVMLFKEIRNEKDYSNTPVKDLYEAHGALSTISRGAGTPPTAVDGNYSFEVQISVNDASKYGLVVCAAPFIIADRTVYFLGEMQYSINSLANYYLNHDGATLSKAALNILAGN